MTSSSTGYLSFGGYPSGINLQFTSMLFDSNNPTFYFFTLTGISVGRRLLPAVPSVFALGGTIIDSSTVVTRLPPTAYSALQSAFRQAMAAYKSAPALLTLDTCYDLSGSSARATIPTVALHLAVGRQSLWRRPGLCTRRARRRCAWHLRPTEPTVTWGSWAMCSRGGRRCSTTSPAKSLALAPAVAVK